MKKKYISFDILFQLLSQLPDNPEITSIALTNDTYKIKFSLDYQNCKEEILKYSIDELMVLIKNFDEES